MKTPKKELLALKFKRIVSHYSIVAKTSSRYGLFFVVLKWGGIEMTGAKPGRGPLHDEKEEITPRSGQLGKPVFSLIALPTFRFKLNLG